MTKCPACGGTTGFEYRDPGIIVYNAMWGDSREKWECVEIEHNNPLPKTVCCLDCGRRIKRKQVEHGS